MGTRSFLISVKDIYAQKIILGKKHVELRKSFPIDSEGSRVYIYVSAPAKQIIGYFCIDKINKLPTLSLWDVAGHLSSLSKVDFFNYFSGKQYGISLHFKTFVPLPLPRSLDYIKNMWPKFHPPQSFIYIAKDIENSLLGKCERHNHSLYLM